MDSRLIRSAALADRCQPWQIPEVDSPAGQRPAGNPADHRAERERARQEGFAEGRSAGLAAAREEIAARAAALDGALDALARPFEDLDQRFHEEILQLVQAVARQLLRREMHHDPRHVIGVVREALDALPMAARDVVVRLHPADATLLSECLPEPNAERHWRIEADAVMERGGCIVVTAQSQIDGRLDTRLARTIARMLEDERKEDADAPGADPGQ